MPTITSVYLVESLLFITNISVSKKKSRERTTPTVRTIPRKTIKIAKDRGKGFGTGTGSINIDIKT